MANAAHVCAVPWGGGSKRCATDFRVHEGILHMSHCTLCYTLEIRKLCAVRSTYYTAVPGGIVSAATLAPRGICPLEGRYRDNIYLVLTRVPPPVDEH